METQLRVLVGTLEDIRKQRRMKVKVKDREVLIITHKENVFALDLHCFHRGHSLFSGDIEDIGGHDCIKCPEHKQLIELSTGSKYRKKYREDEGYDIIPESCIQRTHTVNITDGKVYVIPNKERKDFYASDKYNPYKPDV